MNGLIPTDSQAALLAALERCPTHGYALRQRLSGRGRGVYVLLTRMRARGWVGRVHAPGGPGGGRWVYGLTEDGAQALRRWRAAFAVG
jgi:DNA-binding PadR family transcriptional regulator